MIVCKGCGSFKLARIVGAVLDLRPHELREPCDKVLEFDHEYHCPTCGPEPELPPVALSVKLPPRCWRCDGPLDDDALLELRRRQPGDVPPVCKPCAEYFAGRARAPEHRAGKG